MKPNFRKVVFISLLSAVLLAGMTWANYRFVLASPGGVDFLVHWVGARALLNGETPYGDKTALEIQQVIYGRPARPGENEDRVVYPIYFALIVGPFALTSDFNLARALCMTSLEIAILGAFWLSFKVIDWRPRPLLFSILMVFSLVWYHGARAIINGNSVATIALFFVGIAWALRSQHDRLAGILLALVTIKPQLAPVPGLLLLLWTISNRRWKFALWFLGSLAALTLAGMALVPSWPLQNVIAIMRYSSYNPPTTVGGVFESWFPGIGKQMGWGVSAVIVGVLFWEWKNVLHTGFERFVWVFSLTLVASQWIGITTDPGNFIILTLPLVLVFKAINRQPNGKMWLGITLTVLLVGLWAMFLLTLPPGSQQQSPVMFFPLPLFLLVALYACRSNYVGENTKALSI
ncbi:MAG: glycosyltransferase family 87 protein [Anaerolineales bacterium]